MRIKIIFVVLLSIVGVLHPLRLRVLDSPDEIISSKKVTVRFEFDKDDSVVYADSVRFSVDSAAVELKSWCGVELPSSEYIPLFRKNKQVYLDSFNVDIVLDFDSLDRDKQRNVLCESNLYLACLTLSKDGKNRSKNLVASFAKSVPISNYRHQRENVNEQHSAGKRAESKSRVEMISGKTIALYDDTVFEYVFIYLQDFVNKIYDFFESEAFLFCYLGLLFGLIIFFIMRFIPVGQRIFYNAPWKQELIRLLHFIWFSFNFYFLKIFLPIYFVLILLSLFFLVLGIYYLKDNKTYSSRLTKVRAFIGMILVVLVFPLLVKAYLFKMVLLP